MNKKISILGCGWLGLALATDLIEKGFEVNGSTTTAARTKELAEKGIKPFVIDIGMLESNVQDFLTADVLIIAITSKNIEDIKKLITHLEESKVQKVLFISSTSVYPFVNGVVTEDTPTADTALAQIEKQFINNSSFQSTIVRFAGLFGYNRKPGNFIKANKAVDNPEGYVNLIHRDDCIEIIEQIIFKDVWNEILNACADDHPKRRDFYLKATEMVGNSSVVFDEHATNDYKIIDSKKLMRLLNFEFIHADLMNAL